MLWYGNPTALPANYQICDGTNGTPDLRDKFVIGASSFATVPKSAISGGPLATGGSETHTHGTQPGSPEFVSSGTDAKILTTVSNVPPYTALYYVMRLS
jgi:hypothetical protein